MILIDFLAFCILTAFHWFTMIFMIFFYCHWFKLILTDFRLFYIILTDFHWFACFPFILLMFTHFHWFSLIFTKTWRDIVYWSFARHRGIKSHSLPYKGYKYNSYNKYPWNCFKHINLKYDIHGIIKVSSWYVNNQR